MKTVFVDVMLNGYFVMQIRYQYSALFPIDMHDVRQKVIEMRPSLKGKDFTMELTHNRVIRR